MSRVLPILFNTDMVRAILDGRKTVTRRVIKNPPHPDMPDNHNYCRMPLLMRKENDSYVEDCMLEPSQLKPDDLVFAVTTIYPNDFTVGFVHEVKVDEEKPDEDYVVIRKIGSDKLCNYYNEDFIKINKDKLGYEILEGLQYKIYRKVLKAFKYLEYGTRFKSIAFDGDICTVQARESFKNDLLFEISFDFDKKTTVAQIGKLLEKADKRKK